MSGPPQARNGGGLRAAAVDAALSPPTAGYTLPGVLHFLQSQWRRAERDRALGDIERADLKARIAQLEAECAAHVAYNADLARRVKMLEAALRAERQRALEALKEQAAPQPADGANGAPGGAAGGAAEASDRAKKEAAQTLQRPASAQQVTVLKYSRGNGSGRAKEILRGYLHEAAILSGSDPDALLAEYQRLSAIKQAYSRQNPPSATYRMPRDQLPPSAEVHVGGAQIPPGVQAAPPQTAPLPQQQGLPAQPTPQIQILRNPQTAQNASLAAVNASAAAPDASSSKPLAQEPASPGSSSTESPDDVVEDDDDETLPDARGDGDPGPAQPRLQRTPTDPVFRSGPSPVGPPEPEQAAVMRKFVEYEAGKRRTTLSRIREIRRMEAGKEPHGPAEPVQADVSSPVSPEQAPPGCAKARLRLALRSHMGGVRALAWHPGENALFSAGEDCVVKLWNIAHPAAGKRMPLDIEPAYTFRAHTAPATAVAPCIDAEGAMGVYTASADSSVLLWAAPEPKRDPYAPHGASPLPRTQLVGHTDAVWDAAAHPFYGTSALLATCSADGTCRIWDGTKLAHVLQGGVSADWVRSSPARVAVGFDDGTVRVYDAFQGKEVASMGGAGDGGSGAQINSVRSHPTLPLLFAACDDGPVRIFDLGTGKCLHALEAHAGGTTCLDVDPDGTAFATGGYDADMLLWDLAALRPTERVATGSAHRDEGLWSVAYGPAHGRVRSLAAGGADGVVRVYEV
ncbi:WD40-repeat-containing domain protein [Hyaloraphidium curvatum]|nr:WD40-repeat-containing domain protein [Hyaloraphidium curvatum]